MGIWTTINTCFKCYTNLPQGAYYYISIKNSKEFVFLYDGLCVVKKSLSQKLLKAFRRKETAVFTRWYGAAWSCSKEPFCECPAGQLPSPCFRWSDGGRLWWFSSQLLEALSWDVPRLLKYLCVFSVTHGSCSGGLQPLFPHSRM